jgi:hypothetical protein
MQYNFLNLQISWTVLAIIFGAIFILCAILAIFTRNAAIQNHSAQALANDVEQERKRKAAAIAVSLALANEPYSDIHEFPLPPTAIVSAWQAVMRAQNMNNRGRPR